MSTQIEWKNIFYFLCYAIEDLKYLNVSNTDIENVYCTNDLLAVLLTKSFDIAYKNGMMTKTKRTEIVTDKVRGKINITKSIQTGAYARGKMVCEINIRDIDDELNRIIKASMNVLLSCDKISDNKINKKNKLGINRRLTLLSNVSNTRVDMSNFNKLHNIPEWYKPVINVCKLIIQDFIAKDNGGRRLLCIDDSHRLCYIYQHFLLNFLKKELKDCKVQALSFKNGKLITDVCIENIRTNRALILDAKWYNSNYNEVSQIAQVNMYIDAYKDERDKCKEVNGLVLFAHTDSNEELLRMPFTDNRTGTTKEITARCLAVNIEFEELKHNIIEVVKQYIH